MNDPSIFADAIWWRRHTEYRAAFGDGEGYPGWAFEAGIEAADYIAMTPEQRRAARRVHRHGAERERIANSLAAYRRVEWDAHREPVRDLLDGTIVGYAPMPVYRRKHGPSPFVTHADPVPRVRERGTHTRELVRATTRGHDHVPERPDA